MRRLPWLLSLLLVGMALFIAVALLWSSGESTLERVRRTGTIRVGHTTEAPYAWRDPQGRVTGEAPEVARAVLDRMGIHHIEWVQTDFSLLMDQLKAGHIDMIAAGLYVTPERAREVRFTRPSFCARTALLVRRGNPHQLHALADLAHQPGVRLAVLAGAVEGEQALQAGVKPSQLVPISDPASAVAAIRSGLADALALSSPSIHYLARHADDVDVAEASDNGAAKATPQGCGALAVRLEDGDLAAALDQALASFVGSAEHRGLVQPLGFGPETLPPRAKE